ncbi:MAG: hypothetical protein SO183_11480 [Fusobacterium mortiferum]|nr:hypothetical protein [Fusobacterium mortiferum]
MKRLALLLGSLLVVTAAASAKEVVPAPVVVEEAPVQIVEKEVIVYRDKEEGFRPNGFVDLQYRYYGQTESQDTLWGSNNNASRTQLEGKIQMTEKQALDFRVRDYNSLDHAGILGKDAAGKETRGNVGGTQTRLRYYYNHGLVGDSKVDMTSFVKYEKNGDQSLEYQLKFQLADYLFDNDFVKTTNFEVGPRYIYSWGSGNDSDYTNTLGLYLDWINQLPWGFSTEVEIDGLHYNIYGKNAEKVDGKETNLKDDSFDLSVAAKILHNYNLYTNGAYSVDWAFEGGYDTYKWSSLDQFVPVKGSKYEDSTYELYAQPSLTLSYQATDFVTLYGTLGAEYRNWNFITQSEAQDWRWQPYAIVGFRTTF